VEVDQRRSYLEVLLPQHAPKPSERRRAQRYRLGVRDRTGPARHDEQSQGTVARMPHPGLRELQHPHRTALHLVHPLAQRHPPPPRHPPTAPPPSFTPPTATCLPPSLPVPTARSSSSRSSMASAHASSPRPATSARASWLSSPATTQPASPGERGLEDN